MLRLRAQTLVGLALLCLTATACSGLIGFLDDGNTETAPSCEPLEAAIVSMTAGWDPGHAGPVDDWLDLAGRDLERAFADTCPPHNIFVVAPAGLQEYILSSGAAATATAGLTEPADLGAALDDLYRLEIAAYRSRFPELADSSDPTARERLRALAATHRTRTALQRLARGLGEVTSSLWLAVPVIEARSVIATTDTENAALFAQIQPPDDDGTTWVAETTDVVWHVLLLDAGGDVVDTAPVVGEDPTSLFGVAHGNTVFDAAPLLLPVTGVGSSGIEVLPVALSALTDPPQRAATLNARVPIWMLVLPSSEQAEAVTTAQWLRDTAASLLADGGPWIVAAAADGSPDRAFASIIRPTSALKVVQSALTSTVVAPTQAGAAVSAIAIAFQPTELPAALVPLTSASPDDGAVDLAAILDQEANLLLLWSRQAGPSTRLYSTVYRGATSDATRIDNRVSPQSQPRLFATGAESFALWTEETAGTPRLRLARWNPAAEIFDASASLVTRTSDQYGAAVASGDAAVITWIEREQDAEAIYAATVSANGEVSDTVVAAVTCPAPAVLGPAISANDDSVSIVWQEDFCTNRSLAAVTSVDGGLSFGAIVHLTESDAPDIEPAQVVKGANGEFRIEVAHLTDRDQLRYVSTTTLEVLDEAPLIAQLHARRSRNGTPLIWWLRGVSDRYEVVLTEPDSDRLAQSVLMRSQSPLRSLEVDIQPDGRFFITGITETIDGGSVYVQTDIP